MERGPSEGCKCRERGWRLSQIQHLAEQRDACATSRLPSEDIEPGNKPIFMPFCSGILALKKKKKRQGWRKVFHRDNQGATLIVPPQHRHCLSFPWGTHLPLPAWGLGSHWVLHPNSKPAAPHPQTHPAPCTHPGEQSLTPPAWRRFVSGHGWGSQGPSEPHEAVLGGFMLWFPPGREPGWVLLRAHASPPRIA